MLSRVADSLYWMSRQIERAEHSARLVDVYLNSMLDQGPQTGASHQQLLLRSLGMKPKEERENSYELARRLTFDLENANSIVSCISTSRENANQIREQISTEMYEQLNRLYLHVRSPNVIDEWRAQPSEFFAEVKEGVHLFTGVTLDTFPHGEQFLFIRVGKNLERAASMLLLLRAHAQSLSPEGDVDEGDSATAGNYLEWVGLLRSCSCFEAYCREYTADLRARRIVEFLLFDEEMPRSVRFCIDNIQRDLNSIAKATGRTRDSALARAAGKLRAQVDYASVDDILNSDFEKFLTEVRNCCGQIHSALFSTYVRYSVGATMSV
ncbi:alpha-E domain-containing protein [bacterium]|nr:MAG: alpha-E domain-containing protein [bacterium]